MNLSGVIRRLESAAPLHHAEEWDHTGLLLHPLQVGSIRKIMLTIDLTEAVADEAIAEQCGLILTYHPILFRPTGRLLTEKAQERTVMKLVQQNIAVYSPHTALDAVPGGVNDWLAESLGEGEVSMLHPGASTDAGRGRLVRLKHAVKLNVLAWRIRTHLGIDYLRVAPAGDHSVQSVALCAGSGAEAFRQVRADCFFTGEMSHHHVLAACAQGAHVVLCEHTHTERGFLPRFRSLLSKMLERNMEIILSKSDADPIQLDQQQSPDGRK